MNGYEYFEVLEMLKNHKKNLNDNIKMVEYFLSKEEREKFFESLLILNVDIDDLTDRCLANNTCPNCGEPLQDHKWTDDCGNHIIRYCSDCDYKEE